MKIGMCCSLEKIEEVMNAGYDYVELNMQDIVYLEEDKFEKLLRTFNDKKVNVYAFNCFIPANLKITGSKVDYDKINPYVNLALKRASLLGAKFVVFGSGGARNVEDGFDFNKASEQIVVFLRLCATYAVQYNLNIALEHLNKNECNILTSIKDSLEMVKTVNHPNIRLLIDYYHKEIEGESNDIISECKDYLGHVHIASSPARNFPKSDLENDYKSFFSELKAIGYFGGISIEGSSDNFKKDLFISQQFLSNHINENKNS